MECKKCGKEMYHEPTNKEFERFVEFFYCGECKLKFEIIRSISGKLVSSEWIDLSKIIRTSK